MASPMRVKTRRSIAVLLLLRPRYSESNPVRAAAVTTQHKSPLPQHERSISDGISRFFCVHQLFQNDDQRNSHITQTFSRSSFSTSRTCTRIVRDAPFTSNESWLSIRWPCNCHMYQPACQIRCWSQFVAFFSLLSSQGNASASRDCRKMTRDQ